MLSRVKVRKSLNGDALFGAIRDSFAKIPDHRPANSQILLRDALMSAFAMFSLKDPSLLAFEERRKQLEGNLESIYGIGRVPSDTQMRAILDEVVPDLVRGAYGNVFSQLQRGKALEKLVFLDGYYLLSLDGTGFYTSEKLGSEACMRKVNKRGKVTYYQQMLGAAIVHPGFKEVVSLAPEMILRQDGRSKNDCERNAAKRFLKKFREDHPRLKVIVNEDALSPNAPHIRDLQRYDCRFILGVKQGDHDFLFEEVAKANREGRSREYTVDDEKDPEVRHLFHFVNGMALNKSNPDLLVNFVEYGEEKKGEVRRYFAWVTDIEITTGNVYEIMRGGRARWKIENETFNTLKNQGYNLEHNYGLGKKHLSSVFVMIMMLAFLVDQTQQLCCGLFRAVWQAKKSKIALWESIRSFFSTFHFESMEMLYRALLSHKLVPYQHIENDTS
jgi:hypothetical protein